MASSASSPSSSVAFFSIYDPRRYPAFDNAAFTDELPDFNGSQRQLSARSKQPKRRLHLPNTPAPLDSGGSCVKTAAAVATSKKKTQPPSAAAAAVAADDSLDENSVLDGGAPSELAGSSVGRDKWIAAAGAATAAARSQRRPTLLKLAEAATAAADLSELLSRGIQRQREEPLATQAAKLDHHHHQQQQQPHEQQPFTRATSSSVRHHATWWRGAIAEHLNSRAAHHYFNGERDPATVARATIRGSLTAYRRGPRAAVIGHFEQQQQQKQPLKRAEQVRQSTRL